MKLNLKEIQALDLLIKKLNQDFSYSKNELNIVFRYNNSLWKGNFINYDFKYGYVSQCFIDSYKEIDLKDFKFENLIFESYKVDIRKYRNIKIESMYLLLIELIKLVKSLDLSNFNLYPMLYAAVNLDTKLSLPFLLFNSDDEFEVVSIIESSKDEYIHS